MCVTSARRVDRVWLCALETLLWTGSRGARLGVRTVYTREWL